MKILIIFLLSSPSLFAGFCEHWDTSLKVGKLDKKLVDEASGMVVSYQFKDRFYFVNDHPDGPYIYMSDLTGTPTQKIKIADFDPVDDEELSYGKCGKKYCIYIGDIGDNDKERKNIVVKVIEEEETFASPVIPIKTLTLTYPDGAHNAEAMAIHPSGDLLIFTKTGKSKKGSKIFKLSASSILDKGTTVKTLEPLGKIELSDLIKKEFRATKDDVKITSLAISSNGKKFVLLTYELAIEFNIDLSKIKDFSTVDLKEGKNFNLIKLEILPHQEAIAYSKDDKKLFYTSESGYGHADTPIMEVSCKK